MPEIVKFCIERVRAMHKTWSVHLLDTVEEYTDGLNNLSVQWRSDWVRICALQKGGVWLDASCICTAPVDSWVDMAANNVQGFSAPFAADSLENWAFAAPPNNRLIVKWKEIFRDAIRVGFEIFKQDVPPYIRRHAIFDHMPYLTMHACYLMAAMETGERARLTPACDGPFQYLCQKNFNSARAVRALMQQQLPNPPALIKLRGAETSIFARVKCHPGSFMHLIGMPTERSHAYIGVIGATTIVIALAVILHLFLPCGASDKRH